MGEITKGQGEGGHVPTAECRLLEEACDRVQRQHRGSELVWRVSVIAVSGSLSRAASIDPHLDCSPPASNPQLNLLFQRVSKVETETESFCS